MKVARLFFSRFMSLAEYFFRFNDHLMFGGRDFQRVELEVGQAEFTFDVMCPSGHFYVRKR